MTERERIIGINKTDTVRNIFNNYVKNVPEAVKVYNYLSGCGEIIVTAEEVKEYFRKKGET